MLIPQQPAPRTIAIGDIHGCADALAGLVDYIQHQKFHPREVVVAPGQTEVRPPQPDFSIEGRTPASLLHQMREWYGDFRKEPKQQTQVTWYESGIDEFDWTEGLATPENRQRWTITNSTASSRSTPLYQCK